MTAINFCFNEEWGNNISFNITAGQCPNDDVILFVNWNSLLSAKNSQDLVCTFKNCVQQNCNQDSRFHIYDIEDLNHWLNDYIKKTNSNDLHIEEFVEIIMLVLQSKEKSPQQMEDDLIDLLSSQAFFTIRELIKNRKSIIKSYQSIYKDETLLPLSNFLPPDYYESKKPTITQSLIVQTENEKNLKKMIRKYKKKVAKELAKEGKPSEVALEYERLKKDKKKELALSMSTPIFKQRPTFERINYPFVFDSYIEAKHTAAFVSGQKLDLPNGFQISKNKNWKEISIPIFSKSELKLPENFVTIEIKDLDEIAKIVFAGFKKLNLVQSIVYQAACCTNNNLLICAPTGAGKTNVAMLCILNELRKYYDIESKQFQTQDFKIVYIAPMKALAAEMVNNFSKRLETLKVKVRELTGDIQLTKAQIIETHLIVTTPEKWDIVTRKAKSDIFLMKLIKLLIIDEVHLLQSDRGPVLEALVARTIRHVESTQKMIRIIGLSATLPNYIDVATFLRVNLKEGLFFFDDRFRPVPLYQSFIGVKTPQVGTQMSDMDEICYKKVQALVEKNKQCMIFVHTRMLTYRTASNLKQIAQQEKQINLFKPNNISTKILDRLRNNELRQLLPHGFAIHHAGMTRFDRSLVEKLFKEGHVKVLVCTATLAWGVNLPAHAVIIRGTEIYNPAYGSYVDLSLLDVMQIFGRAGRPQFDKEGHGTIITTSDKLVFYLSLLTNQYPIESQFDKFLADNLNAEVVLGTINTIEEAVEWLGYTYLYTRMLKNPQVYGINYSALNNDPNLMKARREMIIKAAISLDNAQMIRYDESTGCLDPTDLGRMASHFYIKYKTIEVFNQMLHENMLENEILHMIACAEEFEQLKPREEEIEELTFLRHVFCKLKISTASEDKSGKVNILIQAYISRAPIEVASLVSDSLYISQNVIRMARGLFEYTLTKGFASLCNKLLLLSKMLELRMWNHETPFRQFCNELTTSDLQKIQKLGLTIAKVKSQEMTSKILSSFMRTESKGPLLKKLANTFPSLKIVPKIQPVTRTVLRICLEIVASFVWNDNFNGKKSEAFWIWLQDAESEHIYYHQFFKITKLQVIKKETQTLIFTIPLLDPDHIPSHYIIHCDSDRWLGCEQEEAISCKNLILPEKFLPFTKLLNLNPLPVTALNNTLYESIYSFTHFNPIQTQVFHTLYHTDYNVMLGAPTGSGKTNCAEIAMFRVFNKWPKGKIVYIAPLKALVRERVKDWKSRLEFSLNKKVIELTGDTVLDARAIMVSDIIVTTPEKWDGISRSWQNRKYVRDVCLIIIDEIHLLGEDRGPVLEIIVSRTNFINHTFEQNLRIIGLSTAVANAQDLASWLNIGKIGLYNFKPSVRPVPLEVHIAGFPGRHYCPRMASMNKPTFKAIKQHSNSKPVIIFVSSRRQTRLTALDLISFLAQENTKQWLNINQEEIEFLIQNNISDSNLKLTLGFGIGLHHAGLQEKDRSLVEELFLNQKIQILITTATLAWGVNLPAHLVIIKGTEFYDSKIHRYVDFPITDVLQMIGRAGRPQYDEKGKAVILVHDIKKEFYLKFLYEPFPVESHLIPVIEDHLNAEIVGGTIHTKSECVDYLTWTYLFRRIFKNPTYYGLEGVELSKVNKFLSDLTDNALTVLINSSCIELDIENNQILIPTAIGRIASYYYLHHATVKMFIESFVKNDSIDHLLYLLCNAYEYKELPVRHNEDLLNAELAKDCRFSIFESSSYNSPHTKAFLLLQAHFSGLDLPCSDYITDLKSVLDQTIRILQAMIDIAAIKGYLITVIRLIQILQMVSQGVWFDDSSVSFLPYVDSDVIQILSKQISADLPQLIYLAQKDCFHLISEHLHSFLKKHQIIELYNVILSLPLIDISFEISKSDLAENHPEQKKEKFLEEKFLEEKFLEEKFLEEKFLEEKFLEENFLEKKETFKIDQINFPNDPITQRKFYQVVSNTKYVLTLKLFYNTQLSKVNKGLDKAYAPKFPKPKEENWFVIIGNCDSQELIALKRVNLKSAQKVNLVFKTPEQLGRVIYTVFLFSDCYLGLDQQYDLGFEIVP